MEQHKTSSPTGSTEPPACFQIIQKVWQKFRQGTLPPHARALNLQQCLLPPLAPKVGHLLDTWPPTNFSPAPHHPPRRRKEVAPWCLIAFSSGNANTNSTLQKTNISHLGKRKIIFKSAFLGGYVSSQEGSTLKLCWSYCRASYCKDLRVRFWCFFTQIYCLFRSISFFSPHLSV